MKNLRPQAVLAALATIALLATGCVFSISGSEEDRDHHRATKSGPPPEPAPVVVMPTNTEDSATLAEIDAAAKLSFDEGKGAALGNVASRPGISPAIQVHLINTTLRRLSFDDGKIAVLRGLILNPSFSPAAKEAIFRQLELLRFDDSRTAVMKLIQSRAPKANP